MVFLSLNRKLKDNILKDLGIGRNDLFIGILELLRKLRNRCAHIKRIYGYRIRYKFSKINEEELLSYQEYKKNKWENEYHTLFCILKLVKKIIKNNLKDEWNDFLKSLSILFEKFKNTKVKISKIGFPNNWEIELK